MATVTTGQVGFGPKKVNTRLGLLADDLGLSATGESEGRTQAFTQGQGQGQFQQGQGQFQQGQGQVQANAPFVSNSQSGKQNSGEFDGGFNNGDQLCCCVPLNQKCVDPTDIEPDYVGAGLINARIKPSINTRIVNRPGATTHSQQTFCPANQHQCCYGNTIDLSVFGRSCNPPKLERWAQYCNENKIKSSSSKTCGTRNDYSRPLSNLAHAEASPGEFPWTCLLLNQNNDFIGTCALIPNDSSNNNGNGVKVITAAHKLKALEKNDLLKVRVGEYDATGWNKAIEKKEHVEYTVVRILKHDQFNPGRLSNDIALLFVDRPIDLNHPYVNTACLPSCDNQFDFTFKNGTGTRCWVAGWGKDEFNGNFQPIPHKVDIPLVPSGPCNTNLRGALNAQRSGSGNRFQISDSEVCAGGEEGKDACTGDGGSPLVCQSNTGRWTVVGLVTWGVGCASDVPGVYAKISHFTKWINDNNYCSYC